MRRASHALAGLAIALGAAGCALTSRGAALSVRYFSPEPPSAGPVAKEAPAVRPTLRLGRVRGAPALRERIARRESEYEVRYYDDRAWTERPEVYVRRALARTLFESRGFERATGGSAPTLEVDVVSFEEVRTPGVHAARVELRWRLDGEDVALDERTVRVERAVAGDRFEDFVAAMSEALEEATERIADRVAQLATR